MDIHDQNSKSSFKKKSGRDSASKSVMLHDKIGSMKALQIDHDYFNHALQDVGDELLRVQAEEQFPILFNVFTGYSWNLTVNGYPWKPAEVRTKETLWDALPNYLMHGVSCKFTNLNTKRLICDGEIEKVRRHQGGSMEIKVDSMFAPFFLLANTRIELRELPLHMKAEIQHMHNRDLKRQKQASRNEALDPYPKMRQEQVDELLLHHKNAHSGDFVVHSRQEAPTNQRAAFRRVWVSYRTEDTVESFSVFLSEPSIKHPMWIEYAGFFTTLDRPWEVRDPNANGTSVGVTLFDHVDKLRQVNRGLFWRVLPYVNPFENISLHNDVMDGKFKLAAGESRAGL